MEMNLSAAKKYSDTDSPLNSLYEKLISEYSKDTLFIKNLKKITRVMESNKKHSLSSLSIIKM